MFETTTPIAARPAQTLASGMFGFSGNMLPRPRTCEIDPDLYERRMVEAQCGDVRLTPAKVR